MPQDLTEYTDEDLLPMHRVFVEYYMSMNMNGRRAALATGYAESNAGQYASYLIQRPDIKAAIARRMKDKIMSAEEVLLRISAVARVDLTPALRDNGTVDIVKLKELGLSEHLTEIGFDSQGNVKVKVADKLGALTTMARAHRLLGDRNELSGPGGGAIPLSLNVNFVLPGQAPTTELPALPPGDED